MNVADVLGIPSMANDLARVEVALRESVTATDPALTEIAGHLLLAGGGRLRPALAIASAVAGGRAPSEAVVLGGVAVELVHQGSLYHDDVMDEAATRRSVETVNARWGNLIAIVAGDFLLARASGIAASLGTEVAGLLAATIGRLCEGQVSELQSTFRPDRTEASYLESINGKTASLFAAACRIGAITAGLDRTQVDAITTYGEYVGLLYQVRDDILDVTATDEELGKPAGQDLVEGVYTLPVLRALADPVAGPELLSLLGRPLDHPERDKARSIVRTTDGVDQALAVAREYAQAAEASLAPFDRTPAVVALGQFGHRLLERVGS